MHTGDRSVAPWRAGSHLIELRQVGDSPQMRDAAGVNDRGADEIDQLLGDQRLAVVDRVEDLADRDRRHRVLADQPEAFLVLRRRRILHPEQPVRLERLAQPRRPRSASVGDARRAACDDRSRSARGWRRTASAHDRDTSRSTRRFRSGSRRRPARSTAGPWRRRRSTRAPGCRIARGWPCSPDRCSARLRRALRRCPCHWRDRRPSRRRGSSPPSNSYSGIPRDLALEVPQRGVDGGDCAHRHRSAPPVRAAIEVLPDILDPRRIATDQRRNDVIGEIRVATASSRPLRVASPMPCTPCVGFDFQRDEIAARATDDDAAAGYFHACTMD